MINSDKKQRVIVAMSGGVDSSVAAVILKEQGYEVIGITMRLFPTTGDDSLTKQNHGCCTLEDVEDAREVCSILDIPHYLLNFEKEFQQFVIGYFVKEYEKGKTPHPCVACNDKVKFNFLMQKAIAYEADYIATGHYARTSIFMNKRLLLKGIDNNKDQTYFLHGINASVLNDVLFPVGSMSKEEVRDYAYKKGLPNHDKPDSTGICFIGERPFKSFIQKFLPPEPGKIITEDGEILGTHDGLMYFTLGQRKDIGIGGLKNHSGDPWYVANKDIDKNELLVVQGRENKKLWQKKAFAKQMNWLNESFLESIQKKGSIACKAKCRYRQEDANCVITLHEDGVKVHFEEAQWAITHGQYLVIYEPDVCMGGGKIFPHSEH